MDGWVKVRLLLKKTNKQTLNHNIFFEATKLSIETHLTTLIKEAKTTTLFFDYLLLKAMIKNTSVMINLTKRKLIF